MCQFQFKKLNRRERITNLTFSLHFKPFHYTLDKWWPTKLYIKTSHGVVFAVMKYNSILYLPVHLFRLKILWF